jgi:hypothetical protein
MSATLKYDAAAIYWRNSMTQATCLDLLSICANNLCKWLPLCRHCPSFVQYPYVNYLPTLTKRLAPMKGRIPVVRRRARVHFIQVPMKGHFR